MIYMGSKNRIAKYILPIMLQYRTTDMPWVEPFVGGGNMIDKVNGKRIGYDINQNAIDALILIRDNLNLIPKNNTEFTEQDYKNRSIDKPHLKGFASFAYSFASKEWGGWRRNYEDKTDYVKMAYNSAVKQSLKLQGVELICDSYKNIKLRQKSLIYCDPPYKNTTSYKNKFDHDEFYEWCIKMKNDGHIVFMSEYDAPENIFTKIWEKEVKVYMDCKNQYIHNKVEKLFIIKDNL